MLKQVGMHESHRHTLWATVTTWILDIRTNTIAERKHALIPYTTMKGEKKRHNDTKRTSTFSTKGWSSFISKVSNRASHPGRWLWDPAIGQRHQRQRTPGCWCFRRPWSFYWFFLPRSATKIFFWDDPDSMPTGPNALHSFKKGSLGSSCCFYPLCL